MKNSDLKRFFENDASNNNSGFTRLNSDGTVNAPLASNKIETGNAADGMLLAANGEGGVKFVEQGEVGTVVIPNPELTGEEPSLEGIQVGEGKYKLDYAPSSYEIRFIMYKNVPDEVDTLTDEYSFVVHVESSIISNTLHLLIVDGCVPDTVSSVEDLRNYYNDVADIQGKLSIIGYIVSGCIGGAGCSSSAQYQLVRQIEHGEQYSNTAITTQYRVDYAARTFLVYFNDTPIDYMTYLLSADGSTMQCYDFR